MRIRFTIRQLMILIADLAVLFALAALVARTDNRYKPLMYSAILFVSPFSLAILINTLDKSGPVRKNIADALALAEIPAVVAWCSWFYHVYCNNNAFKRAIRNVYIIISLIHTLFTILIVFSYIKKPSPKKRGVSLKATPSAGDAQGRRPPSRRGPSGLVGSQTPQVNEPERDETDA